MDEEKQITFLYNTIVFPPKLPQEQEPKEPRDELHRRLASFWLDCVREYKTATKDPEGISEALEAFAVATEELLSCRPLISGTIAGALTGLKVGAGVAVFIEAQNCGVLFHRYNGKFSAIEMFEASAGNESIMSSSLPLQRDYPGVAVQLKTNFLCKTVRGELSRALADLANYPIKAFEAVSRKAGAKVTEIRDSPSPAAVTQTLTSTLLPFGSFADIHATTKKIRDEICWQRSLLPWCRPPMWTVIRVATQRWLERRFGPASGFRYYKNLQITVLARLCKIIASHPTLSEELHFARAKLAVRLDKLRQVDALDSGVDDYACNALQRATDELEMRWNSTISECTRVLPRCKHPSKEDQVLHLKNSTNVISKRLQLDDTGERCAYQGPPASPARCNMHGTLQDLEIFYFDLQGHDLFVSLFDFEAHVQQMDCSPSIKNCQAIQVMLDRYCSTSASVYKYNADCLGISLLTIMDLWRQLDQIVLHLEPMVGLLSPDIPTNFLRHLRLSDREHLKRVQEFESYLEHRKQGLQKAKMMSPFRDETMKRFACKYYNCEDVGAIMRVTHQRINKDYETRRKQKFNEWNEKVNRIGRLREKASRTYHDRYEDWQNIWRCHAACNSCALQWSIEGVEIDPIEAPLPDDLNLSKWIVFELLCPEVIRIWREVTWKILNDLGRPVIGSESKIFCHLPSYEELKIYHSRGNPRLSLASVEKSFSVTHYGCPKKVANASFKDVVLPHGPKWRFYDDRTSQFLSVFDGLESSLLYEYPGILPTDDEYRPLAFSITRTKHTPNEIIAKQSECHPSMSLFEFNAFGTLRCGEVVQWTNIITELATTSLRLSNDATHYLFCQAALEVGTASDDHDILRNSHRFFHNAEFCQHLFDKLSSRVQSISANWQEATQLRTLLVIVHRLESLTEQRDIKCRCHKLRAIIRKSSREWVGVIRHDLANLEGKEDHPMLRNALLSAALLCRATYTATDDLGEWQPYFETGFTVANEGPVNIQDALAKQRHEIQHHWNRALELEHRAALAARNHPQHVSAAVSMLWRAGEGIRNWSQLEEPNSRWLWALTGSSPGRRAMQVHINLLTGELLVDGRGPDRLPKQYSQHDQYRKLFGSRQISVFPSDVSGMEFTARLPVGAFHFGWKDNSILLCRENGEYQIDMLLPQAVFESSSRTDNDLPIFLIRGQMHWLSMNGEHAGRIHICPQDRALAPALSADWTIDFYNRRATCDRKVLVDPNSDLALSVSELLGSFEQHQNLIISVEENAENEWVSIMLPRFSLVMRISKEGQLYCPDLNGLLLDNQDAGVFIGLRGHLLMFDPINDSKFLIIPHGRIELNRRGTHVVSSIETGGQNNVTFTRLTVNTLLNRLECNGDSKDMLMQAYLHAVTSGLVADPLTKRSGTEEALETLEVVIRQLYQPLEKECDAMLTQVADITPSREFYPKGMQVMQSSYWHPELSSASQVEYFQILVSRIRSRSDDLRRFYNDAARTDSRPLKQESQILHARSKLRSSHFTTWRPAREAAAKENCNIYVARDSMSWNTATTNTTTFARLIKTWSPDISSTQNLALDLHSRGDLIGFHLPFNGTTTTSFFSLSIFPSLGSLIELCRRATRKKDQIKFLFLFPFLAFMLEDDIKVLRSLLAIAMNEDCQKVKPPPWENYSNFRVDEGPDKAKIRKMLLATDRRREPPSLTQRCRETEQQFRDRHRLNKEQHALIASAEVNRFSALIQEQWPCAEILWPQEKCSRIRPESAKKDIETHWERVWRNKKLAEYFDAVTHPMKGKVDGIVTKPVSIPKPRKPSGSNKYLRCDHVALLRQALAAVTALKESDKSQQNLDELENILDDERFRQCSTRREFTSKLKASVEALRKNQHGNSDITASKTIVHPHLSISQHAGNLVHSRLSELQDVMSTHPSFKHLHLGGLWPRVEIADLLPILSVKSNPTNNLHLKKLLIGLAVAVVRRQRLFRISRLLDQGEEVKLKAETETHVHDWNLSDYPEWLILEIEMDVCIRPEQVELAHSMAYPENSKNSIYQLQMGKGKSSLIIPMLAATLPSKNALFRVIVTKSLLHQMGAILKQRLCRTLKRSLVHIPFTRATPKDSESIQVLRRLHGEALGSFGTVLALSEHLQSFQLSGLQCLLDRRLHEGQMLVDTYHWIRGIARDVLDECDHILSPRTQLIYPSGTQTPLDGAPRRWNAIAYLLGIVNSIIWKYEVEHPDDVVVEPHQPNGFPFIHFHSETGGKRFASHLADLLMQPDKDLLPIARLLPGEIELVRSCIGNAPLEKATMHLIKDRFKDEHSVNNFLLMRGMLGGGILPLALSKRWNVDFGLHLERCEIAVPYLARGRPSAASEYGHPDVALLLTMLAYYHQGLTPRQVNLAIEKLQFENEPSDYWDVWARSGNGLTDGLSSWNNVNLDDEQLMCRLQKGLSFSIPAIDYYLDKVVFPRAAREFSRKLVSSSWDLPLCDTQITTGFSGTNDNSKLLPDSILPKDLPLQVHTNAEVLATLLEPRNSDYQLAADSAGKPLYASGLLDMVSKMGVDVMLDAGALVLEMENLQVATAWLERRQDANAAVYFNDTETLSVKYRSGRVELLSKSRYAASLSGCLLYLDQEHCRGTDTKLAATARAALTIGPRQPKDQTVQAAMRLRQIAHGQSVIFVAPPTVDKSIRDFCNLTENSIICSRHVIRWSIEQSCKFIESHDPLWESQRRSYRLRKVRSDDVHGLTGEDQALAAEQVTEIEKRPLAVMYGPDIAKDELDIVQLVEDEHQTLCQASVEEEQERQVDQEVQEEQQRQRPQPDVPCQHNLHPSVRDFALWGTLSNRTQAYQSVFLQMGETEALSQTKSDYLVASGGLDNVFATRDFGRTVQLYKGTGNDHALRPVRYLVWTALKPEYLLLISPFEANALIPEVEKSEKSHILLFEAPRTRLMRSHFDELKFLGIPRLPPPGSISKKLQMGLALFAGSLYFIYSDANEMSSYLRLLNRRLDSEDKRRSMSHIGVEMAKVWQYWIRLRHHGGDGAEAPAGYLIDDRALDPDSRMFRM